MNFLANENFPLVSIKLLRDAGYNVASVIEETPGAKDHDILECAHVENRIVLTFDRDYGELIYKHKLPAPDGVVYTGTLTISPFIIVAGKSSCTPDQSSFAGKCSDCID